MSRDGVPSSALRLRDWSPADVRALAYASEKQHENPIFSIVANSEFPQYYYAELSPVHYPAIRPNRSETNAQGNPYIDVPDDLLDWALPAHGSKRGNCGILSRIEACPNGCAESLRGVICHCHRPECPRCYENAVSRATARTVNLIEQVLALRDAEGLLSELHHVVLSLHPEEIRYRANTLSGFKALRREVQGLARTLGAEGLVLIPHPYRQNKEEECDENLSLGEKPTAYWRGGFHFHAIWLGPFDYKRIAKVHTETGWVIKAIKNEETGKFAFPRHDCAKVVSYLLSHAGVAHGPKKALKSVYYSGEFSDVRAVDEFEIREKAICKSCDSPLVDYDEYLSLLDLKLPEPETLCSSVRRTRKFRVMSRVKSKQLPSYIDPLTDSEKLQFYLANPLFTVLETSSCGPLGPVDELDDADDDVPCSNRPLVNSKAVVEALRIQELMNPFSRARKPRLLLAEGAQQVRRSEPPPSPARAGGGNCCAPPFSESGPLPGENSGSRKEGFAADPRGRQPETARQRTR